MAEDTSNQTKSGSKYAIDFLKEGKVEFTLTLGEKNDKYGELTEVSFHKEIYQPGCVEFKVQVGTKTQASCKGSVDLKYGVDIVAKNYYIFEKVTKGEYVTYKAYSVDKFLTIDKFNMAHKGKRLVTPLSINDDPKAGGIVYTVFGLQEGTKTTKSINEFKSLIDKPVGVPWVKKLNHIGESTDDTIEAVIPYCVQYNESFLDFMVRICNRYGEFLYCEENKWHIGLIATTNVIDISNNSASSAAKYESCITEFQDEATFLNPNYLDSECVDNKGYTLTEDSAIFKKSNGAFTQEYFQPIGNKDYAQLSDYVPPLSTAFDLLKSAEERQNFFDAVAGTAVATSLRLGVASKFQHDVNTKYKTDYYKVLKDTSVEDGSNIKYEFTRNSNQVDVDFCEKILKGEEEAERNKLELGYSTYTHLLLGQKVIYGGQNYVVYRVEAGKEKDKEEHQVVVLVPEVQGVFYPLPMKQLHTRKASPQRAVVVNNFDPERLGRVQVKYPWQTKTEPLTADATPWIRVCYPMASNESGFMFFPKKDDEVLIDYEEGNIERPFVAGSFYSKNNSPSVPSSTQMVGAVKSITSDNGHHISFTDLSGYKFISDIIPLPFFSLLSKFGLLSSPCMGDAAEDMLEWGKDLRKYLAGGFEIADYLGVYSIKGSTHGRNITISSPVGNVVVDAFTGITINAPHGDVNIVGKNVNIEARNNLIIQSGSNIKQPYFSTDVKSLDEWKKSIFRTAPAFETGVLKIGYDLSFHRTWLEVLFRPIGGAMLIKSYRYLCLEAGEGDANIGLKRDYVANNIKVLAKLTNYYLLVRSLLDDIRTLITRIRLVSFPFKDTNNFVLKDINVMKDIIKGKIKENKDFQDEHTWGQREGYLAEVNAMRKHFQYVKQRGIVKNSKFLKEMIKEYEAAIERLEKGLLGMSEANHNQKIEVKVLEKFDATTSENCKKILFNSIADYVEDDKDLKLLLHLDESKVDDWTSSLGINKGIVIGPSKTAMTKVTLFAPLKKTLAFGGVLDDKWWNKLDDGGIVYSVTKGQYKLITKGADNQFKEETKSNRNADLLSKVVTEIKTCIDGARFLDMVLPAN